MIPFNIQNPGFLGGLGSITFASLYQSRQALTTVQKSWFNEWFSGQDIDTSIWRKNNINGTGTFAMADVIDEGYSIKTNAATGSGNSLIDFTDKRHYSNTASVLIATVRRVSSSVFCGAGLNNTGQLFTTINGTYVYGVTSGNYSVVTGNGTTTTTTSMGVASDTVWNKYKLVVGASSVIATLNDGNSTTTTATLPSTNLQPMFDVAEFTTATVEGRIKNLEVYNT